MKRGSWCAVVASLSMGCGAPPRPSPAAPPPAPAVSVEAAPAAPPPRPETPDADFRRSPPTIEPGYPKARPLPIEEARTLSGLRVVVAPEHAYPIVSVQLVVRWSRDTKAGEARELKRALSQRGPGSILTALEALGATALVEVHPDALHIAANLSSSELHRALEALAAFVVEPALASSVTGFALWGRGSSFAAEASGLVLPSEHPYARFDAGGSYSNPVLLESLKKLLRTDGVSVVVAGDAYAGKVAASLDGVLGQRKAAAFAEPRVDRSLPKGAILIDTEQETGVSLVALGPSRGAPDYAAALIANALLRTAGDGRWADHGWTSTEIATHYEAARAESPWAVSVGTRPDRVGDAIEGLLAAIREMTVTDARLSQAVRPWIAWTDTLLDRQSDHAWALARLLVEGDGDPSRLRAALLALTTRDIRQVLDARFEKKHTRLVVRGPAKRVRVAVDKAGFGAARVVKR